MISFPAIALVIFAVVGVIFALWVRRASEQRDERIGGEGHDGSVPEMPEVASQTQKDTPAVKKNKKIGMLVGGFIIFFIIATSFYEEFGEGADGGELSFAIFIPILFAVFISIMAANKKKQQKRQKLPEQYQNVLRVVALLSVVAVIGAITFFVYSQR